MKSLSSKTQSAGGGFCWKRLRSNVRLEMEEVEDGGSAAPSLPPLSCLAALGVVGVQRVGRKRAGNGQRASWGAETVGSGKYVPSKVEVSCLLVSRPQATGIYRNKVNSSLVHLSEWLRWKIQM